MKVTDDTQEIVAIAFKANELFLTLSDERELIIPLNKLPEIESLSKAEREQYEVIDGRYLSFLAIDDVYSLDELQTARS